jgi:hypothetical protein
MKMKFMVMLLLAFMINDSVAQIKVDALPQKPLEPVNKKWRYSIGVYASMDAEGIYIAPSIKGAVAYSFRTKLAVEAYAHYFNAKVNNAMEKGSLLLATIGIQPVCLLGKHATKGMYAGVGLCLQHRVEDYGSATQVVNDTRTKIMPSYSIGYKVPSAKTGAQFAVELLGTGPYSENDANGRYIELLTQLSLGIKVVF